MSYHGKKHFRIELGVGYIPQACDRHEKQDGYDATCIACQRKPEKEIPIPHLAGRFVEVLNPALLPYGAKKELYAFPPSLPPDATYEERERREHALMERRERIVTGLITAWNLSAVDDEKDTVLPLPMEDRTSLDLAPDIVNYVFAGLAREERRQEALPKETAISSSLD